MSRFPSLVALLSLACRAGTAPQGMSTDVALSLERPPGFDALLSDSFRARHLEWWQALPADHGEISLVRANSGGNFTELVLVERVESGAGCRRDLVFLMYWYEGDEDGPVDFESGRLDGDCCEGLPCERSPVGWIVHLSEALRTDDSDALAALVPSGDSIRVHTGWHEPEGSGERSASPLAEDVPANGLQVSGPVVGTDGIQCTELDADGGFACHSSAGGYQARYEWHLDNNRAVLLSVDEESH